MSNITRQEPRIAEIETLAVTSADEIAARTRLSAALRRVGVPDDWTPPAGSKVAPTPATSIEDRLRAGRERIAQEGGPVAPAPITPTPPAEALLGLPGDPGPAPAPAVPLDRAALFAAFVKSARNLQTVDICNFNTAFATAKLTGTFIAPPLAPVKQHATLLPVDPGTQYDPYKDLT